MLLFCVNVCITRNMKKRKKTELSEEVWKKAITKHGLHNSYKTILKEPDVPVTTVADIIKARETAAWMWPHEIKWVKIEEKGCLNGEERAQETFKTDPSWPSSCNDFKSKLFVAGWMKISCVLEDPENFLQRNAQKTARLEFTTLQVETSFWRNVLWRHSERKVRVFFFFG